MAKFAVRSLLPNNLLCYFTSAQDVRKIFGGIIVMPPLPVAMLVGEARDMRAQWNGRIYRGCRLADLALLAFAFVRCCAT